ncbi:response regulator [Methylobacterium durans]|uniref:response regulator n=1 Tax=Methylobacterium durans TaxID=2202825 RepID=UPI002AFFEBD2|nr:response regulator [Methylobacterium durans]MEA1834783.1 response regulator [Methylobacterium durans]
MPFDPAAMSATVLVVEDESMVRTVAVDMLEEAGFPVLQAATADAAWAILERAEEIGVLFTDVDMPGSMDGLALASRVAERWPHIRLVVTSGRVGLRDADMPDDGRFLLKPYRQAQLLNAIDTAA